MQAMRESAEEESAQDSTGALPDDSGGKSHSNRKPGGRRWSRAKADLIVIVLICVVLAFVSSTFDGLEHLVEWAEEYEDYELDEIFSLLIFLSFGLGLFAWRRTKELRQQIVHRDKAENAMRHLAMHDTLTGLPNRALLAKRLEQELARADRESALLAVFALDLDMFKRINDVYGHAAGDALLIAASERLTSAVRKMDTVARMGGDEFVIVQPCEAGCDQAAALASRVVKAMAEPYELSGHKFVSSVSIGIAFSSKGSHDPAELLRAADVALYRAKAEGRSTYRFFDEFMDEALCQRQNLERCLRDAVANEQFSLYFQPLYTIPGQILTGFEALLRWDHPELGRVPPDKFIPIAEEIGAIQSIGTWVLEEACRIAAGWERPLSVAVNVSPMQFKQHDLAKSFKSIIEQSGLDPERLEIEITETVLMQDTESVLKELTEMREFGVRIAMDDFGTGYSSLSYLRKFPFDKIKIDRSFVTHLERGGEDSAIIKAVVAMGNGLGMTTLAEGVETEDQLSQLSAAGCESAQGYFLGFPMPEAEAMDLINGSSDDVLQPQRKRA